MSESICVTVCCRGRLLMLSYRQAEEKVRCWVTPTQMVDVGGAVRVEATVPRAAAAAATATLWWRVDFQVIQDPSLPDIQYRRLKWVREEQRCMKTPVMAQNTFTELSELHFSPSRIPLLPDHQKRRSAV
jgi:hypothetical protein